MENTTVGEFGIRRDGYSNPKVVDHSESKEQVDMDGLPSDNKSGLSKSKGTKYN